jgi:fimbrial isopeptide formation D2 family protein
MAYAHRRVVGGISTEESLKMDRWIGAAGTPDAGSSMTRTARRAAVAARARLRRVMAVVVVLALGVVGLAVAPLSSAAGSGATIIKEVVGQPAGHVYAVGEQVIYRLNVQCSGLRLPCGVVTVTDVMDSNLQITAAGVTLPTGVLTGTLPPMTKSVTGQTVTVTLGAPGAEFQDGTSLDIVLVATVTGYPLTPVAGVIPNQASLTATAAPPDASQIVNINVVPPTKDWSLQKDANFTSIAGGELLTYTVLWTRPVKTGGLDITSASFTDVLDPRLEYVSSVLQYSSLTPAPTPTYDAATHTVSVANVGSIDAQSPTYCSTTTCYSITRVVITVRVPPNAKSGTALAPGTVIPNTATSNVVYQDGTTGTLTGSRDVTVAAPVKSVYAYKDFGYGGPSSVPPTGAATWRIGADNNGNSTLTNFTVIDHLPTVAGAGAAAEPCAGAQLPIASAAGPARRGSDRRLQL